MIQSDTKQILEDLTKPRLTPQLDEKMIEFVTERQGEAIQAFLRLGSQAAAAEALSMSASGFRRLLSEAKRRASQRGWNPYEERIGVSPEGYKVKGVSTFYGMNDEGVLVPRGKWVKTQVEKEHQIQMLLDACEPLKEAVQGKSNFIPSPKKRGILKDYMSVYPWGDPHFGMYAWAMESGANFNLEIAERTLFGAVDELVSMSPPSEKALIINLGDFFHADNMQNMTARSGHVLDVDTRWPKVLEIGLRAFVRCIERCLEKHSEVHVINEIGNHDDHTSMMLAVVLASHFRNNPRVTIDTSKKTFHFFEHGKCLIGVTHGHNTKASDLPIRMAEEKEAWGRTKHRMWYTGHVHHDSLKEFRAGVTVETFRTTAAKDAWHASKGYSSMRDMKCDVLHARKGKKIRYTVTVDELEDDDE